MIEKRSKRRLKKEIFTIVKNIVLTKNWLTVSNFGGFLKDHTEKMCWLSVFPIKNQRYIHYIQNFLVASISEKLIKNIFRTETTSGSLF